MAQKQKIIVILRRLIISLLLFLCVLGLGAFLLLTDEDRSIKPQQPITLSQISTDTIHSITIERQNMEDIVFLKKEPYWYMQAPFSLPANSTRITSLLEILQAPSYRQFSAADNDLTPFMLALPRVSVMFNDIRLSFGDRTPLEEKLRYALLDDTVHIIYDNFFHYLQASPTLFISPKLIPADTVLAAIRFPDTIIRSNNCRTHQKIITAWSQAEAISIRRYENIEPIYRIMLELTTGDAMTFDVISDRPNLILARPAKKIQYYISAQISDKLFPPQS